MTYAARFSACFVGVSPGCALLLSALLAACGSPANPPQSPTNDTTPPTTTTGDGKVLGADEVPPAQKLESGPTLDSKDGLKPAAQPGHD
jgi:hypothetical protein